MRPKQNDMINIVNGFGKRGDKVDRIILHADLNSFFASVECLFHPELKTVPMAVAGDEEKRHGIILAKNEPAKKYGIKTAEPIWQAKRKCPGLITVTPHHDQYLKYSRMVKQIYQRYTDQVESFSIDESWLDITGSMSDSGKEFADALRNTVKNETGLTISVGVSWNKVFAKLASDMKKPDATTVISRDNFKVKVWTLPAADLLFVGRATDNVLKKYGVHTIGDIAALSPEFLQRILGKAGKELWIYSNGLDVAPVAHTTDKEEIKSIGNSITGAKDIESADEAKKIVFKLSDSVAQRLRKHNMKCRAVQITLKDRDFHEIERQGKLSLSSNTAGEIAEKAMNLLTGNYNFEIPLRLIGVRACDLTNPEEGEQLSLFHDSAKHKRMENLEKSIDSIRDKFGENAVQRAIFIKKDE